MHRFVGCSAEHWDREIARAAGGALPDGWARALESRRVHALATQLVPVEGAVALLDGLDRCGIPYRLASNSDQAHVVRCLRTVGLADRFAGRVHCAEDVPRGKPAPDVYLEAARRLGVPAGGCVAVEDSANGLRAAAAAGMPVIAVPNPHYPPEDDALALAAASVPEVGEVTPGLVERVS